MQPVKTLDELFSAVEKGIASLGLKENEECFFRGHSRNSHQLLPTLLRHANGSVNYAQENPRFKLSRAKLQALESDLFFEFQARARELHQQEFNEWDILFFMRHHGVATRLLDWTEVLGVALFFATASLTEGSTPCIWLLNPYLLNEHEKSWEVRELISPVYLYDKEHDDYSDYLVDEGYRFGWKFPVALYPIQRSARLHAQRGYFTIHGDDRRPLEVLYPECVTRIDISVAALPEIERYLKFAGITDYLLFPDLDGLQRELHGKYGIA